MTKMLVKSLMKEGEEVPAQEMDSEEAQRQQEAPPEIDMDKWAWIA